MTLSDTHLVLLSAAAQHELRLLLRPDKLTDKAAATLAGRLTKASVVEEILVKADQPHWSTNDAGEAVGLRITAAGLDAIGLGEEIANLTAQEDRPADAGRAASDPTDAAQQGVAVVPCPPAPRPGSKQALLVGMLSGEGGASIEALMTATGWLPHTVRAALTGLRQKGYKLNKYRDGAGVMHYQLPGPAGETDAPAAQRTA